MANLQNTKLIPLTQGKFAIVDEADYDWLNQWKWYISNTGYAARKPYDKITGKSPKTILMHRIIMRTAINIFIDHVNTNTLDNRKANLRIYNKSQNAMNMCKKENRSSMYKGVNWDRNRKKWRARIKIDYKEIWIGRFNTEQEAALAYNEAAKKYFGGFARLNKI